MRKFFYLTNRTYSSTQIAAEITPLLQAIANKDLSRARSIFSTEVPKDRQTIQKMMALCSEKLDLKGVQAMISLTEPDVSDLNCFVRTYCQVLSKENVKSGITQAISRILKLFKEYKLEPNDETLEEIVAYCITSNHPEIALDFFPEFKVSQDLSNYLIHNLSLIQGKPRKAYELSKNFECNQLTYKLILHGAIEFDDSELLCEMYQKNLFKLEDIEPEVIFCGIKRNRLHDSVFLIEELIKVNRLDEKLLLRVFQFFFEKGETSDDGFQHLLKFISKLNWMSYKQLFVNTLMQLFTIHAPNEEIMLWMESKL